MITAIVPAAGESRRMGRPKLLLPIGGRPLIERLVRAFLDGGADRVVVVAPPASRPESDAVAGSAESAGAIVVRPIRETKQMRETVETALPLVEAGPILLAPGDSPAVDAELVRSVVAQGRLDPERIWIPTFDGRKGHPIWLPADLARGIPGLPEGVGINRLVAKHSRRVVLLPTSVEGIADDLDTPDDYDRWRADPRFAP